jgi:hypothetical protein
MIDYKAGATPATSIAPIVKTASVNGTGVDLAGYNGAQLVFHCGVVTDGTFTPSIEESDSSGSGYAAVAAADTIGSLVAMTSGSIQSVGYAGTKRYVRPVITVSGSPSTGAVVAAVVIKHGGRKQS